MVTTKDIISGTHAGGQRANLNNQNKQPAEQIDESINPENMTILNYTKKQLTSILPIFYTTLKEIISQTD